MAGVTLTEAMKPGVKGEKIPEPVREKIDRAHEQIQEDAAMRRLCFRFEKGESYWFLNGKGHLDFLPTVTNPGRGGKEAHRIRNKYNFIRPIVQGKVSAATQRVPSYETLPSTTDPEDRSAASLAAQVALYGYDKWGLRRKTVEAVKLALVQGEAFALPYFDPNVGPYTIDLEREEVIGQGEIKVLILSGNEVGWEPGCNFEDSPWWVIQRARPKDEIEQAPGFVGGSLKADATTSDIPTDRGKASDSQMVLVTEYFERPCPKYPNGRRLVAANDRVIFPPEDYPVRGPDGKVVDNPVMTRLSWAVDPDSDRDSGLVEQLLDLQRTVNDCWNKQLEWKNRALMPQGKAPRGSNPTRQTDAAGAITEYNVAQGAGFEWQQTPPVPRELREMREDAILHMRILGSDVDVQAEADVAARTVNAAIEQAQAQWQSFLGDLAEWHSRVMRACLSLVQQHYTEPRLLQIRGRYGTEPIRDFLGADLRGQVDVRVLPGSIESKSRAAIREELAFIAQAFPNALSVETALATLNGGNAESLIMGYELHVAKAHRMVELMRQGPAAFETLPPRFDPDVPDLATGQMGSMVPGWMPRKQDNIGIHKQVVADYMTTDEFAQQPTEVQALFDLYWEGLERTEMDRALQAAQQEQQMAAQLGMANAAAPQGEIASPSGPRVSEAQAPPQS